MSFTFHVFHACPDLICIRKRTQYTTYVVGVPARHRCHVRTVYSLSLNNLLLTCRGNPLATVLRPCTDLQASSKFQIPYVRRTANVNYRAVCSTSYSYLVPTTFLIAFIAILDYNIAWNMRDNSKTGLRVMLPIKREKMNKYTVP